MKTHKWIPHVVMQARTVPVEGLTGALRTDPLGRAARGIVILALVLGGLGADAAATSGYGSGDHASAHQPTGNIRLGANSYLISRDHITGRPWMY
jgi:hypothetical protein